MTTREDVYCCLWGGNKWMDKLEGDWGQCKDEVVARALERKVGVQCVPALREERRARQHIDEENGRTKKRARRVTLPETKSRRPGSDKNYSFLIDIKGDNQTIVHWAKGAARIQSQVYQRGARSIQNTLHNLMRQWGLELLIRVIT